ncbi:MAG: rod shape-determining protein MreC [Ruminococcaceae bacterium]|nr:rod shape-determining protein MreC [Oscillospiraceae bacterium]
MNFFRSRFFVVCVAIAILLALVPTLIAAFGGTDLLRSVMGTVAKPFTMCGSGIANAFNGFIDVFAQYDELEAENEALRAELEELKQKEYNEELLREQNEWLKDYINLHEINPSLRFTDASVISREAGNYSTIITLNRGSAHGVKKNMPVLTDDGLIGYVSEIGLDWCKVSTIVEPSSSIGVYTDREQQLGVLSGDADLRAKGLCKMTYIDGDGNLGIGDKIYTAGGSDSIYPSGLLIGSVSSVDIDSVTGEMVAQVEPSVDFLDLGSIRNVMIVVGLGNSGGN